jgi:hypothetical protein
MRRVNGFPKNLQRLRGLILKHNLARVHPSVVFWQQTGDVSHHQVSIVLPGEPAFGSSGINWRQFQRFPDSHRHWWTLSPQPKAEHIFRCSSQSNWNNGHLGSIDQKTDTRLGPAQAGRM